MGRCWYCTEKIEKGEDFVLEGQYLGMIHKLGFAPFWFGLEWFGYVYHRTCFLEMLSSEHKPKRDAKKYCSECGKEIPKGSKLCPSCILSRKNRVSRLTHRKGKML